MKIKICSSHLGPVNRNWLTMTSIAAMFAVVLLVIGLLPPSSSDAVAKDADQGVTRPGELRVTKLILVDSKGKERVTLAADELPADPNSPVLAVLDMKGELLARIGRTNDAGPSIQFFVDGKRTASYSYMNLSMRSPKGDVDRLYLGLPIATDPIAGEIVSPTLNFNSKTGKNVADLRATDEEGGSLHLFDKDGNLAFQKP